MARVKDLWHVEVPDPGDPAKKIKQKTRRHPDNGGSKDAKRWLAVWIGPDGREKTKAFKIADAAKKYARRMEEDAERGEYIDPVAGKQLLGPLGRTWLGLRDVGASSRIRYERTLRLHIEPTFAERQAKSVRPSEILEWLRKLGETHGYSTQALAYFILCGMFDHAVADNLRKDNPARSPIVDKPHKDPNERAPWGVERIWSVCDFHHEAYRLIPLLCAGLGLRRGEAFGLAFGDFDFEAGKVHIRRQVAMVGKVLCFKLPKGGKTRTVPLPRGVATAVKAFIKAYEPRPCILPWMQERGGLAAEPHTCKILIRFYGDHPRTHDTPMRDAAYDRTIWKPALSKAGVIGPPAKNKDGRTVYPAAPDDGAHALRHYYVTTLLDAGVSLAGVMDFVGHSKRSAKGAAVTLGVYAHVTEETFEKARAAVDASLFRLRAVQDHSADGTVAELGASR